MQAKKVRTAPALVLSILLLSVASRYIDSAVLGYGDQLYLSMIVLRLIVFVLPCIFYIKINGTGYLSELNLRPASPGKTGFLLLAFLVMTAGSAAVKMLLAYTGVPASEFLRYESMVAVSKTTELTGVLYIAAAFAVLPALTEELAFRAVILTEYNKSGLGPVMSLLFTSVLYALTSFRAEMLPLYLFTGAVLTVTVYVTRSVPAAMLLHLLYNLFNIFFEGYLLRLLQMRENLTLVAFIVVTLFLFSLVLMLGEAERQYYNEALSPDAPAPDEKSGSRKPQAGGLKIIGEALGSPAFLLCLGAFAAGIFLYE